MSNPVTGFPKAAREIDAASLFRACHIHEARDSTLALMRHCWLKPDQPLIVGHHTADLCRQMDRARRRFDAGKSTRMIFVLPFRHGKSDVSSRYGPAGLVGNNHDMEVMIGSYGSELSEDFGRDIKQIMGSREFSEIYPDFPGWNRASDRARHRRVKGGAGGFLCLGMGGGATGRGSHCLILDDTFKNREEAESATTRESRWNSFIDDFLSRLAPVHIVLIVQTRWHTDDTIGRILSRNNPDHEDYDAEFPQFELTHYRAKGAENIPLTGSEYLFPQRFPVEWYETQFGSRSPYSAASLLQGEPFVRGGNMLSTDNIQILPAGAEFPEWVRADSLRWVRAWDLAYSEKQLAKDDPDWTLGGRVAVIERDGADIIIVDDVQAFRAEAGERNRRIIDVARRDKDRGIPQHIEANGPQKAGYTTLRDALDGVAVVHPFYPQGDKVVRAGYVEPSFEAGNVMIRCSPKHEVLLMEQLSNFPSDGVHDDAVDMITTGYQCAKERNRLGAGKTPVNTWRAAMV